MNIKIKDLTPNTERLKVYGNRIFTKEQVEKIRSER